jgi:rhodanese-related sulfurtransferase
MKTFFLILLSIFYIQSSAQECKSAILLEPIDFKNHISNQEVQIIDVRTAREYNFGHMEGAINTDVLKYEEFKLKTNDLDKEKPVYIYCRSGNRSVLAAKTLCALGFKEVYDLKGGYLTWL